jgi:hypothetical protein
MRSFTLAQIERAILYWRKHHDHALLYHNSPDGARQEQVLTALYGRMLGQRLGAIDIDRISSAEFAALGCLYGVPPTDPKARDGEAPSG